MNCAPFKQKDCSARNNEDPVLEELGIPFANSPDPMWVYDLSTLEFLEVNEAAIRAYGFSRKEFKNMTLLDIRPTEDIQLFLHGWKHPRESTEDNWQHMDKNGKVFPVSITSWELTLTGRKAELVMARGIVHASVVASSR